ncbi:Kinase superfamily protein [Hibiscus syriacus]|uniref:FRIGIDA-like protein n=1 Tax=Hibiscus syriacus TaxID=106335 RepID=A0A6A2XU40_HIBSY|nr:FRIGIDA-like protein 2 isoform X2 [Hibiscus syriacus]KAE8679152.1 Kinase superfamily protein [Hibiscus syriacus]
MSSENVSVTPSLRAIESAIKLIDVKKEELKKAFDDLQANSLHLSSFSVSWSDLDTHFTKLKNSVTQRFRTLESRESIRNPIDDASVLKLTLYSTQSPVSKQGDPPAPNPSPEQDRVESFTGTMVNQPLNQLVSSNVEKPSSSNSVGVKSDGSVPPTGGTGSVVTRPELKEFCERMDGKGLRKYIHDRVKEREAIQMELPGALSSAADPGAMVLDAMEGFYTENSQSKDDTEPGTLELRRVCVVLLEQLMETGISINEEVRERAKKLALEWNGKVKLLKDNSLETLAYLHLVATYSLGPIVDKEELVDYFFTIAKFQQAIVLCRSIGLGEKIHDLIKKLLDDEKQLLAVKFIFELGLAEKFPPGPLLDVYLEDTKRHATQHIAADGEIDALKSVIKIIEERNLDTEYSQEPLQKRIEQLKRQQADKKAPATPATFKPQQQQAAQKAIQVAAKQAKKKKKKRAPAKQQQQSGNKHPKTTASVVHAVPSLSAAGSTSAIPPFQQAHLRPAGLLPDHSAAYLRSPAPPFGMPCSTPVANPYAGPSAQMYGVAGAPMGFPLNSNPAASHFYNYDRRPIYGVYGIPPQYHPSYPPR